MRQLQLKACAMTTALFSVGAIAISCFTLSQNQAQATEECHKQQILNASNCQGDGLEPEEEKLYKLVNQYRTQQGLPAIPISKSLNIVANRHVRDLAENIGTLTHGWSDCPYDGNIQTTWPCMWEAPQRLKTSYPGRGYENAHGGTRGYKARASAALKSWQHSSAHNQVILNQGIWQNHKWNALGIGIYGGFAVLWFGEEPDADENTNRNSSKIPNPVSIPNPQSTNFPQEPSQNLSKPVLNSTPKSGNLW